jgi:hypothetical protein
MLLNAKIFIIGFAAASIVVTVFVMTRKMGVALKMLCVMAILAAIGVTLEMPPLKQFGAWLKNEDAVAYVNGVSFRFPAGSVLGHRDHRFSAFATTIMGFPAVKDFYDVEMSRTVVSEHGGKFYLTGVEQGREVVVVVEEKGLACDLGVYGFEEMLKYNLRDYADVVEKDGRLSEFLVED